MVNQLCIAGLIQGLSEGIALGKSSGLNMNKVLRKNEIYYHIKKYVSLNIPIIGKIIDEGRVDIDIAGPHINIKSEKGISFDIPTEPFQEYPDEN